MTHQALERKCTHIHGLAPSPSLAERRRRGGGERGRKENKGTGMDSYKDRGGMRLCLRMY